MKNIKYALLFLTILFLVGCTTVQKSAFDGQTKKLDFSQNSYFVLGVEIDHAFNPRFNPNRQITLYIEKVGPKNQADYIQLLLKPKEFEREPNGAVSGYFRGALPPGNYVLKSVSGEAAIFPALGKYYLPMQSPFTLGQNEVVYLGKLRARTRKKRKGEFTAGPIAPVIPQSIAGFSSSTFDVEISDDAEYAKVWVRKAYPSLANEELSIRLLPKYDRSQFDRKNAEPQPDPVFLNKKEVAIAVSGSAYPDTVAELKSPISKDFRRVARIAHKNKLYRDSGVLNAIVDRVEQAIQSPNIVADNLQIDAFAYCMIILGEVNTSQSEELLNKVKQSALPKSIKSRAASALKRMKR